MDSIDHLWYRGGFPRSCLAASDEASRSWRRDFVRTFLERDLPALGVTIPSATLRQFWTMLAHYHGQTWNGSELARAFGVSQPAVQRYRDLLAGAYVLRILRPWSENVGKRIVKSPKVFIRDSGILHTLLGLADREALFGHPKVSASFEGLVVELLTRRLRAEPEECFFWATHAGAELDLLVISGDLRLGFEVKRTTSPKVTKSMTRCSPFPVDRSPPWRGTDGGSVASLQSRLSLIRMKMRTRRTSGANVSPNSPTLR